MAVKFEQDEIVALATPASLKFFERQLEMVNQALYLQGDERQIRMLQGQAQLLDSIVKQIRAYRAKA